MNICGCGTQAGYVHTVGCPYPLYRGSDAQWAAWQEASADLAEGNRLIAQADEDRRTYPDIDPARLGFLRELVTTWGGSLADLVERDRNPGPGGYEDEGTNRR